MPRHALSLLSTAFKKCKTMSRVITQGTCRRCPRSTLKSWHSDYPRSISSKSSLRFYARFPYSALSAVVDEVKNRQFFHDMETLQIWAGYLDLHKGGRGDLTERTSQDAEESSAEFIRICSMLDETCNLSSGDSDQNSETSDDDGGWWWYLSYEYSILYIWVSRQSYYGEIESDFCAYRMAIVLVSLAIA